jgi:thiamine-phosphate pyrophosphorylase
MARLDPEALGVYVVTSGSGPRGRGHRDIVSAAIDGGATAIQLRASELSDEELEPVARAVAASCRHAGVLSMVNDRPEVAAASGVGGLHVGQDADIAKARELLGDLLVLGVSVDDESQARAAEAAGADYLGVTVWPTATKPEARAHGLEGLGRVVASTSLPVVGIGGIGPGNAADVIRVGAAGVAVVSAVAAADDPVSITRRLRTVVETARRERAMR